MNFIQCLFFFWPTIQCLFNITNDIKISAKKASLEATTDLLLQRTLRHHYHYCMGN